MGVATWHKSISLVTLAGAEKHLAKHRNHVKMRQITDVKSNRMQLNSTHTKTFSDYLKQPGKHSVHQRDGVRINILTTTFILNLIKCNSVVCLRNLILLFIKIRKLQMKEGINVGQVSLVSFFHRIYQWFICCSNDCKYDLANKTVSFSYKTCWAFMLLFDLHCN